MFLRQHPARGLLRDQEGPEGGDLQCVLDLGGHEMDERTARARAGVVDDDIRSTVRAFEVGEQPLHLGLVLGITSEGHRARLAHNGASFAASRAAMATARPSFLNSRVSEALNP